MMRVRTVLSMAAAFMLVSTAPALACGFLIAPNGTVQLVRTTTLAAYADGVEHYVTSFEYAGGDTEFGSIIPLPGIPTKVERGGDWTLQRLVQETSPPLPQREIPAFAALSADAVEVILETKVDALDITVLKGGGPQVVEWATEHGYFLPPDAGEVLSFYAERSPIFLAARFDPQRAQELGQLTGDGTPLHVTIPIDNPWVPLRILGMGKQPFDRVEADLYLLTERAPSMLGPSEGLTVERSEPASEVLLADLRSDVGMKWVPAEMWLSFMTLDVAAESLAWDLAIDQSGAGNPSPEAAGMFTPLPTPITAPAGSSLWVIGLIALLATVGLVFMVAAPLAAARRSLRTPRPSSDRGRPPLGKGDGGK